MDWNTLLAELGLPGAIIAGLLWHIRRLELRQRDLVDSERETQRDVRQLVVDQTQAMNDLTAAVRELAKSEKSR